VFMPRRRVAKWPLLLVVALVAAVALAACGSSSNSSGSSGSSGAPGNTATKSPVKIGIIYSGTGQTAFPWALNAAEVGAAAANAAGGLMGHKIVIDSCDDQSTQQASSICAQKLLVQDKDVMLAGNTGIFDGSVPAVLKAQHTILFGGWSGGINEEENPLNYTPKVTFANFATFPALLPPGHHSVALFTSDTAAAIVGVKQVIPIYTAAGDTAKVIPVPLTATNMSTPCLQAKQMGADTGVTYFNASVQFASVAQACNGIGVNLDWAMESGSTTTGVMQALDQFHLKSIISTTVNMSGVKALIADSKKYGISVSQPYTDSALEAYLGFKLLPKVVAGANSLDPTTIQAWLSKQTAFNTDGYTAPVNFTPSHYFKPFPGVHNTCTYQATEKGGVWTSTTTKPICTTLTGTIIK
jgi:ABC-type branched-subunit amino acid transport system substrate-binding protein